MSFAPIVTTNSTPIVTVSPNITSSPTSVFSSNVTYDQILQSLGSFVYGSEFIYLATTTYTQIGQPMKYLHFDANGNQAQTYLPFAVDPYQSQPAIYYETNSDEIILDGFSSLTFNLEPNITVYFKTLEKTEGVKFFEDYCNYLIDEEDATKA